MTRTPEDLKRRALYLESLTIAWGVVEAVIPIWSGIAAHSIALIGFGLDSVIEVFAAVVVIWQLQEVKEERRRRALRLIAVSFFMLAAYVLAESVRGLLLRVEAQGSVAGIVVTTASLIVMPLLAWRKRRVGQELGNAVLMAEASETILCAILAGSTLVGLVLNAVLGWWWADPVAAIVIAVLAVNEGREAWEGRARMGGETSC